MQLFGILYNQNLKVFKNYTKQKFDFNTYRNRDKQLCIRHIEALNKYNRFNTQ